MKWVKNFIKGASIKRWHVDNIIGQETVAEHSYGVAMMVIAITDGSCRKELIMEALFHDLAEQECGDSPHQVKAKYPHLKNLLKTIEGVWNISNGFHINLTEEEKIIIQFADKLQAMSFCLQQRRMGNTCMDEVFERARIYLDAFENYPGISWTIAHDMIRDYKELKGE